MSGTINTREARHAQASFTSWKLSIIGAMMRDPNILPSDFRVGVALLQHMNAETGLLYPSQGLLAREVHMSPRNVRECVGRLRAAGWLRWSRGNRQRANEYEFAQDEIEAAQNHSDVVSERNHSSSRDHKSDVLRGTTVPLPRGTVVPPNTLREHSLPKRATK